MKKRRNRIHHLTLIAIVFLLLLSGCSKKEEAQPEESDEPEQSQEVIDQDDKAEDTDFVPEEVDKGSNPLTGLVMKESAEGKRPVAIMVENSQPARPQWGMDDPEYAPDIILEAEVEYGITRMMWLFADFTSLPEVIGPVRSARPPYVLLCHPGR